MCLQFKWDVFRVPISVNMVLSCNKGKWILTLTGGSEGAPAEVAFSLSRSDISS